MSKQDLYDTEFTLFDLSNSVIDENGDSVHEKTIVDTYPCQIDNLNGDDAVRYGKNNELATHVIMCDQIDYITTSDEIVCQNMQLDISFIAYNLGGLTNLTRGYEIYCIFRGWIPTESIDSQTSSSSTSGL